MSAHKAGQANVTAGFGDEQVLRRLAGRNLLFIQEQQAIYELDDLSAYVWDATAQGQSPASISRELVREGLEPDLAQETVSECLNRLKRMLLA